MLSKADRHFFPGDDTEAVVRSVRETLARDGIEIALVAPDVWSGRATGPVSYGVIPRAAVAVTRVREGFFVDLRLSADLDTTALVIGVVALLVFWPAALVLAILAHQDFHNRATLVLSAVWAPLASRIGRDPGVRDLPGRPAPPPG